jgi:prepilin-type N-terminal cleavage/methylation domain-containing protein
MKQRGFTVIELLVVLVILIVGAWLFFSEQDNVNAVQRDSARKVAINAMYYNLEEVYYPQHNYYPQHIDSKTLRAMDPALFTDPTGIALGESDSDYRYDGTGCSTDGHCTGYTLRSIMERESDYTKTNRSHTNN